ncbi:MAG TPA: zf-HC2 domain-containing protein [Thermoanaerobaculia bacterium]|nr:zf-HC2 domain-containing protein [Thermoanaerobaculia bacterium]
MNCPIESIDRLIDGELSDGEASGVEQHIRECSECAARLARAAVQKSAIRRAGRRFTPRPELRDAVRRALRGAPPAEVIALPPASSYRPRVFLVAAALVLAIAAGALVGLFAKRGENQRSALAELADLHATTLASANPVDVVSTDRHTVKPWFEGRVPFTFDLPDLGAGDIAIAGGRVAWLRQSAAAQILIRDRQHRLSLFIVQQGSSAATALPDGNRSAGTFRYVSWSRDGVRYLLLGDVDDNELRRVVKALR